MADQPLTDLERWGHLLTYVSFYVVGGAVIGVLVAFPALIMEAPAAPTMIAYVIIGGIIGAGVGFREWMKFEDELHLEWRKTRQAEQEWQGKEKAKSMASACCKCVECGTRLRDGTKVRPTYDSTSHDEYVFLGYLCATCGITNTYGEAKWPDDWEDFSSEGCCGTHRSRRVGRLR